MRSSSLLLDLLRSQLRRHPGRAVTLGVTVALAVTLLTSSFVLAASLRTAIDQGLAVQWEGTDVVVRTGLGTSDSELSGAGGAGRGLLRRRRAGRLRRARGRAGLRLLHPDDSRGSDRRDGPGHLPGVPGQRPDLPVAALGRGARPRAGTAGDRPHPAHPRAAAHPAGRPGLDRQPRAGRGQLQGHRRHRRAWLPGVLQRRLRRRLRADGTTARRGHRRQRRAPARGSRHRRRRRAGRRQRGRPRRFRPDHEGADRGRGLGRADSPVRHRRRALQLLAARPGGGRDRARHLDRGLARVASPAPGAAAQRGSDPRPDLRPGARRGADAGCARQRGRRAGGNRSCARGASR